MHQFERLHERLREKSEQVDARPVTYVAFGDSITHGAMEADVYEHEQLYHQLLRHRLLGRYPSTVINVINSGVSGDTAVGARQRLERDVLSYRPDFVTILFGANDAHSGPAGLYSFRETMLTVIRSIQSATDADILLMTPPMLAKHDNPAIHTVHRDLIPGFFDTELGGYTRQYVDALHDIARETRVPIVDIYAMWARMEETGVDIHTRFANGLNHPDRAFHAELTDVLTSVICKGVDA